MNRALSVEITQLTIDPDMKVNDPVPAVRCVPRKVHLARKAPVGRSAFRVGKPIGDGHAGLIRKLANGLAGLLGMFAVCSNPADTVQRERRASAVLAAQVTLSA